MHWPDNSQLSPGIISSVSPRITAMKLSVDISAAMCIPGYSLPSSKARMNVVFPVEYWPATNITDEFILKIVTHHKEHRLSLNVGLTVRRISQNVEQSFSFKREQRLLISFVELKFGQFDPGFATWLFSFTFPRSSDTEFGSFLLPRFPMVREYVTL